ncbi:phage late control D family protein [Aggregatibacter actinomycetemcomitans]|uniref:contractile injection system protein, VgrG/Pvc8 family n=1 Tax=Aggregatibacter actinomycetemcomitans TaxID=714 RepID=UPI00197BFC91|nr:contractile injection system protein, VgrG/Pvc8 family [Aggregatibacter actinomycetemcomitans]MBN6076995.1 phage late control D family protein [Aggregatibacter actinomycetemcomitans]
MLDVNLLNFDRKNHRTPKFKVEVIGKDKKRNDITQVVTARLGHLSIIDNRGFEADTLDLELTDHDGKLALPPRNAAIDVAIGWEGQQLIKKGQYLVDEVQYSGAPDKLTIRARSADLKGSLSEQKERSFHNIKLETLVEQIGKENGLDAFVGFEYEKSVVDHIDQTNESDINLLTRLAEQFGAMATVKNGVLLFMKLGEAKSITGKPIQPMKITKQEGDNYTFTIAESANYKAVRAYWHDTDTGKRGEITIDENTKITKQRRMTKGRTLKNGTVKGRHLSKRKYNVLEQTEPVTSDSDQIKTLRHTYASEKDAIRGAKSAFDRLKRGVATFNIDLAYGDPMLMPETPLELSGFKSEIDAANWLITKVTHTITDNGYVSQIECELKIENDGVEVRKSG